MNQKKILVLSYSQTGQLNSLVENFTKPFLGNENFELIFKNIEPKNKYPSRNWWRPVTAVARRGRGWNDEGV